MNRRLATCDLGSNSLLLLVVDVEPDGGLIRVHEDLALTRIGRGIGASGRLDPASEAATLEALGRFVAATRDFEAGSLQCVATAGLRDVEPRERARFLASAAALGVEVELIDGPREAALTALAVVRSLPDLGDEAWILDVGGRSTEVVSLRGGRPVRRQSFSLGGVAVTEALLTRDPPGAEQLAAARRHAAGVLAGVEVEVEAGVRQVIAAGGTATTIAASLHRIDPYDGDRVHGIRLPLAELSAALEDWAERPLADLLRRPGLPPGRADIAVGGGVALEAALLHLGADHVVVSDRGLRWGLAYELAASSAG